MLAIVRNKSYSAARRPSLSEALLVGSLLSWVLVWNVVDLRRTSRAYPTLMPPGDLANFNWMSRVDIARTSSNTDAWAVQWYALLLVVITTWFGAFVVKIVAGKILGLWKNVKGELRHAPVPTTLEKKGFQACEIRIQLECRIPSFEDGALAMSPIQEVFNPRRIRHVPATAKPVEGPMIPERVTIEPKTETAGKSMPNLALSDIILTIDIPPCPPDQEDDAVVELSELLERW